MREPEDELARVDTFAWESQTAEEAKGPGGGYSLGGSRKDSEDFSWRRHHSDKDLRGSIDGDGFSFRMEREDASVDPDEFGFS